MTPDDPGLNPTNDPCRARRDVNGRPNKSGKILIRKRSPRKKRLVRGRQLFSNGVSIPVRLAVRFSNLRPSLFLRANVRMAAPRLDDISAARAIFERSTRYQERNSVRFRVSAILSAWWSSTSGLVI